MSDLLLRGRVDMSEAKSALSEAAQSVKKYEKEIESAAATTGRFQRSIGAQMREVRQLLTYLEANGKANSDAYREAQKQLARLTDQMGDMHKAAQMMASDTVNLDIAKNSLTGLITAMGALQSVTALTGTESESFNKVMKGLQTTLGLVTAAIVLANLAQKEFIATMMANPYGMALAAVAALVGVMLSLGTATNECDEATKKFNDTLTQERAKVEQEEAKLNALLAIAGDVTESYDLRQKAVDEINRKYPELHANIDKETSALSYDIAAYNDLATAIRNAAMARAYEEKLTELARQKIAAEEDLAQKETINAYNQAHKYDQAITGGGENGNQAQAQVTFLQEAARSAEAVTQAKANLAKIEQQILDASRKSQEYYLQSNNTGHEHHTGGGGTSGNSTPEFGSDEWLQQQDEDTVKRYWDWVYNGIMNEARNHPIEVKPVIIPPEEEEPEDPEFLKILENYRFEQRKQEIDAERALNESSLQEQMDYYRSIYENEQLSYEERAEAYEHFLDKKAEMAQQEQQINEQTIQSFQSMMGSFSSIMSSLSKTAKDEAQEKRLQAAAIMTQAIANIIQGYAAASAQANEMGPLGWAAFSLAGAAQVASVIAQMNQLYKQTETFASGGIFGGSTTIGDYNYARVNKGEMILNGTQQARLFDMFNGTGAKTQSERGEVVFRLQGSELIGVIENYERTHRIR